ncbi:MAG: hypothetical protein JAZ11_03045 [Candidatus Thiodiazotropha lotti]|nr:hypothetical protein [Candidatus Thiodiazotropha lotti]
MTTNKNLQLLSRWYFIVARELANDDIQAAQTFTGLPRHFLTALCDADLDDIEKLNNSVSILPFKPRLPSHLLTRLLKSPKEVSDAAVILGVKSNAGPSD